jgi:hypothetical protein
MRNAPILGLLLLLAACGGGQGGGTSGAIRAVLGGLGLPMPGDPPAEPDRLAIAEAESPEVDRAAPQLRLGLGARTASALLIQQQGNRRLWHAPGGVVVATDGARVVATSGLPTLITGTRFDGPDPLENPLELLGRSTEARRLVDQSGAARDPASMRFGLAFDCRLRATRTAEAGVVLVEERCRVPGLAPVVNSFWAEETSGRVTHAEQWVGTGLPQMVLVFP